MTTLLALFAVAALQSGTPLLDHFLNKADVNGGRLLLILLDADGDGRQEIFLASSTTCGNGGCVWQVYSPTSVPNQTRYLGEAAFSVAGFRFTRSAHTLRYCWHMSATECELGEYRFARGTMSAHRLGSCGSTSARCEAELKQITEWQQQEHPQMLSAVVPEDGSLERLEWSQAGVPVSSAAVPSLDAALVVQK
jgi:hypothetical protein